MLAVADADHTHGVAQSLLHLAGRANADQPLVALLVFHR
jgi:hypothetical protein